MQKHMNTCFKHFMYFILEFKLVSDKVNDGVHLRSLC